MKQTTIALNRCVQMRVQAIGRKVFHRAVVRHHVSFLFVSSSSTVTLQGLNGRTSRRATEARTAWVSAWSDIPVHPSCSPFFFKLMCTLQGGGEGKTSGHCSVLSWREATRNILKTAHCVWPRLLPLTARHTSRQVMDPLVVCLHVTFYKNLTVPGLNAPCSHRQHIGGTHL